MAKDLFTVETTPRSTPKSESLKKRARKRRVQQTGDNTWTVLGSKSLRDARDRYRVTINGSGRYHCECFDMDYGETRRRSNCSHVMGVKMARRGDLPLEILEKPQTGGRRKESEAGDGRWSDQAVSLDRDILLGQLRGSHYGSAPATDNPVQSETELEWGGDEPSIAVDEVSAVDSLQSVPRKTPLTGLPAPYPDPSAPIPLRPHVEGSELPNDPPKPQHEMFGHPPIPVKFKAYRDHQWEAIRDIDAEYRAGKKVVFLEAPTGSGKTLIAETIGRLWGKGTGPKRGHVYLCTTKSLQQQILDDFGYGDQIKGKANYKTQLSANATCDDCDGNWTEGLDTCSYCNHRDECPYQVAKTTAANSHLPILNTAYYLGETTGQYSWFAGRPLTIIDECDVLENVLMSWIEVNVTSRLRQKLNVKSIPKKTVAEDWVRWLGEELIPAIDQYRRDQAAQGRLFDDGEDLKRKRELRRLSELRAKATDMVNAFDEDDTAAWVMTGYERAKADTAADLTFKPVRVKDYARELLWSRGDKFLLMSATIISAKQMAADLGLEDDEWGSVTVESTFPAERRPVLIDGVAAVGFKTKQTAYPKVAAKIGEIIDAYPDVRMLVHVVSYELGKYLYEHVNSDRVMTYWNARERDRALAKFRATNDAVMLAPSFERGIDLPEELCEVMVIAKVPYPNLGDKQIKARRFLRGGQTWYAVQTIRTIVQMTGRGMRSKDDWCDTYVLDKNFARLYRDNKRLFPNWWAEGLAVGRTDPKGRGLWKAARERQE
jgi:Rad3-related DNA helicase